MNISVKLYCRQDIHSLQKPVVYLSAAVSSTVVWLIFAYKLHGSHFGRSAQGAGRECVNKRLHWVCIGVKLSAYTAHKVNHMAVELHILIEINVHTVAVA